MNTSNTLQVLARFATPADCDAICQLERETLEPPWTRATIENVLRDNKYFVLVAEVENQIIGHAIAWNVIDEGEIDRLAIANAWRRRGLGARLLDDLIIAAYHRGIQTLLLEVRENNVAAQQLYLSRAFELVGERHDYYPDGSSALIMRHSVEPTKKSDR